MLDSIATSSHKTLQQLKIQIYHLMSVSSFFTVNQLKSFQPLKFKFTHLQKLSFIMIVSLLVDTALQRTVISLQHFDRCPLRCINQQIQESFQFLHDIFIECSTTPGSAACRFVLFVFLRIIGRVFTYNQKRKNT